MPMWRRINANCNVDILPARAEKEFWCFGVDQILISILYAVYGIHSHVLSSADAAVVSGAK